MHGSALISGLLLLAFAVVITLVGMWIRYNVTPEQLGGSGALMYAASLLPKGLTVLLIFGLLSAILSSTDTCLINASVILAKDVFKKESVVEAVRKPAHRLFQVSEINYHTALLALGYKLLRAYLGFDCPAVSVYVCAFAVVPRKEVCAVKRS